MTVTVEEPATPIADVASALNAAAGALALHAPILSGPDGREVAPTLRLVEHAQEALRGAALTCTPEPLMAEDVLASVKYSLVLSAAKWALTDELGYGAAYKEASAAFAEAMCDKGDGAKAPGRCLVLPKKGSAVDFNIDRPAQCPSFGAGPSLGWISMMLGDARGFEWGCPNGRGGELSGTEGRTLVACFQCALGVACAVARGALDPDGCQSAFWGLLVEDCWDDVGGLFFEWED